LECGQRSITPNVVLRCIANITAGQIASLHKFPEDLFSSDVRFCFRRPCAGAGFGEGTDRRADIALAGGLEIRITPLGRASFSVWRETTIPLKTRAFLIRREMAARGALRAVPGIRSKPFNFGCHNVSLVRAFIRPVLVDKPTF